MTQYPIAPPPESKTLPSRTEDFDPEADDGRCKASTWHAARKPLPKRVKYETLYGPGGFNRCIYTTEEHVQHQDEFGNVFLLEPRFKVLRIAPRQS